MEATTSEDTRQATRTMKLTTGGANTTTRTTWACKEITLVELRVEQVEDEGQHDVQQIKRAKEINVVVGVVALPVEAVRTIC